MLTTTLRSPPSSPFGDKETGRESNLPKPTGGKDRIRIWTQATQRAHAHMCVCLLRIWPRQASSEPAEPARGKQVQTPPGSLPHVTFPDRCSPLHTAGTLVFYFSLTSCIVVRYAQHNAKPSVMVSIFFWGFYSFSPYILSLWSILFLVYGVTVPLISFFCMWTSNVPCTVCWKHCPFGGAWGK